MNKKKVIAKQIFFFALVLIAVLSTTQIRAQTINNGRGRFIFNTDVKQWSEVLKTTLGSDYMTKKGQPFVELGFRIRLKKKVILACHYEIEITNLSDKNGIQFEMDNSYTKNKVKLKAGQTKVVKLIYANLKQKIKTVEDCAKCDWDIVFHGVEGYK